MNEPTFIEQIIKGYFTALHCNVYEHKETFTIELTPEVDKAIMNRPFYWHYVEATGQKGIPKTLELTLKPPTENNDAMWIHFGSPLIRKIEQHLSEKAQITRQFQQIVASQKTLLEPWLLVNFQLSYKGKQLKEELHSLGINLINGLSLVQMMEQLNTIELSTSIPTYCYTVSPLITVQSAYKRLELLLLDHITSMEHNWAVESQRLLEDEVRMIEYFYSDPDNKTRKSEEISAVEKRLKPTITFEVISGGFLFLVERFGRN